MIVNREVIQRMFGGMVSQGGTVLGGGGNSGVSSLWVEENYISKEFFNTLFEQHYQIRVLVKRDETTVSDVTTEYVTAPNIIIETGSVVESETDEETHQTITTTTTTSIIGIKAKAGFWSDSFVSALGKNESGGGGGGGVTLNEPLDSINNAGLASHPQSAGQTIMWNGSTWAYGAAGGVTSISMTVPTGFAVNPATISTNGTFVITFASGYSLPTTAKQTAWDGAVTDVATLKGYFTNGVAKSALKLATARTIWGQSFDGTGNVTGTLWYVGDINSNVLGAINNFNKIELNAAANAGNGGAIYFHYNGMSGRASGYIINDADGLVSVLTPTGNIGLKVGTQTGDYIQIGNIKIVYDNTDNRNVLKVAGNEYIYSGRLFLDNNQAILFKDSNDNDRNVLMLNGSNTLAIGYQTRQAGYATDIQGDPIIFATNNGQSTDSRLEVGEFSEAGRFWVKQGTQGLRIGDGLITWDATNNALKVSAYNGGAANLYALGGVSALGYSGSGGSNTDSSYSKSYTMPYRGSSTSDRYWQKLGRYTMNADAQVLTIDVFTGNGYNGNASQNAWARIIIKRSNKTSGTSEVVGVTCEQFGPAISNGKILVRVSASAYNQGEVWIKCPWGYPMGAYTVSGNYSSWEHNSAQSPSGSNPTQNLQSVGYYDSTGTMTTGE